MRLASPLPIEQTTPPVTKTNLVRLGKLIGVFLGRGFMASPVSYTDRWKPTQAHGHFGVIGTGSGAY